MEGGRGKGLLSHRRPAASRMAAVGKENICPASNSKEHLSASRSPLPEGFPRTPLQDITHILSPINILPNAAADDGDGMELGQCRRGRKRSKCVVETQTSRCMTRSECELISSEVWMGLRKCAMPQAVTSDAHVSGEPKLSKGVAAVNLAHLTENKGLPVAASLTDVEAEEDMLLRRESRHTEVLKAEVVEASCAAKSPKAKLKRSARPSSSTPACASLRSPQEKQKMSNLLKFR